MIKKIVLVLIIIAVSANARESKILSYIGNFMPNLTEAGFALNCVNVYEKVSQFVRVTNRLVSSVRRAKSDWERTSENVTRLYEDIKYLKNIDPYDMDSWQAGIDDFNFMVRYDKMNAVAAFDMLERHTLGASTTYVRQVLTLDDYIEAKNEKRRAVAQIFHQPTYQSDLLDAQAAIRSYRTQTIEQLRALQSADVMIMQVAQVKRMQDLYDKTKAHYDALSIEIASLEASASSSSMMMKTDSIIEESSNIIAINLTEALCAKERIEEMEKSASDLAAAFRRLMGEAINNQETGNINSLPDVPVDVTNFSATDPDKVPQPVKPKTGAQKGAADSKREVSNHDIINLQNAAAFLSLKQESLKRDVLAMKVNTMAYIVSLEANKRNDVQKQVVLQGHQNRMIELVLEDMQ